MSSRQYDAAIDAYQQALQFNPSDADLWAGIGITWRLLGQYPEAMVALQKALELNPDHNQAQTNLDAVMEALQDAQNQATTP
jgi:tetratricopeptide (TPR) repeat protein